jgi:hypothetical protein
MSQGREQWFSNLLSGSRWKGVMQVEVHRKGFCSWCQNSFADHALMHWVT